MTKQSPPLSKLGQQLRELRELRGWSLRDAEDKTGVSNGYIYLLEKARIRKPSPKILGKLGSAYGFDYERLLELAGYLTHDDRTQAKGGDEILLNIIQNLSERDKEEVKKFVRYLANRK